MSTIDDLACAKLAAAGCENPKAVLRDLKLFGFPEKDLSQYLRAKAWELEEAVALGLGRHPRNLSLSAIREKCPEQIDPQGKARPDDLLPTAQLFLDRYELLKRAAFIGDTKSEERGEKIWFKLVDLATYARNEWDYMPAAAHALMEAATEPAAATGPAPAIFAPASANTPAAGQVEMHSVRVKGKDAALNWLLSLMSEFPKSPPPQFTKKPDLEEHVRARFEITQFDFREVFRSAKEMSGVKWYKRGHKSKN